MSDVHHEAPAFLSLYGEGRVTADQIDEFIEAWHSSGDEEKRSLAKYLGMSDEEYSVWLMSHGALPSILAARRQQRPLAEVIGMYLADLRSSHTPDGSAIHALSHWLARRAGGRGGAAD